MLVPWSGCACALHAAAGRREAWAAHLAGALVCLCLCWQMAADAACHQLAGRHHVPAAPGPALPQHCTLLGCALHTHPKSIVPYCVSLWVCLSRPLLLCVPLPSVSVSLGTPGRRTLHNLRAAQKTACRIQSREQCPRCCSSTNRYYQSPLSLSLPCLLLSDLCVASACRQDCSAPSDQQRLFRGTGAPHESRPLHVPSRPGGSQRVSPPPPPPSHPPRAPVHSSQRSFTSATSLQLTSTTCNPPKSSVE